MKLDEAITRELSKRSAYPEDDAAYILKIVERWLRHNHFDDAADALETEHMP